MENNKIIPIGRSIRKKLAKCALLLTAVSAAFPVLAAPHDDFKFSTPNRIDFSLDSSFSKSDGNFEKSGNAFTRFNSGYGYQVFDMNLGLRAEIAPRFNVYASTRFASAESQTMSFTTAQTKTNTAFSSGTLGTDFVLVSGSVLVIPDFSLSYPFEETERKSDAKVAVGEGVLEGTARLVLRVERRWYRIGGFGGITYRDQGRSMIAPYGALFELTFGRWNFGVDARGYQSVSYDKETDREVTIDASYFCPVNGCSKRYGSFNPSAMSSNLWMRVNINREFALHLGGGMNWTGSNVSRDATFFGGIVYRWNHDGARRRSSVEESYVSFDEDLKDGVDQRIFREVPNKSMNLPARSRSRTRKKPTDESRRQERGGTVNLQEELNKTEMQIDSDSYRQNED